MEKPTRVVLETNQITSLSKTMDSRINKKDVEHCLAHVEALEQCFTQNGNQNY